MQYFSPFQKQISDLTTADLLVLKDTTEGWYVEYKRQLPNMGSAAKSISAFANSYGGWLFYGIDEGPERTAGSFLGIDRKDVSTIEQQIQRAASVAINPIPYFITKTIYGPCSELNLGPDKAIIIVHIPPGNNPPYVHSCGKIYRRAGDAADPVSENDRHSLENLWNKGKLYRDSFAKFVSTPPEVSTSEEDNPFIKLYLFPDPWQQQEISSEISFLDFANFMKDGAPDKGGIPFDNIFTMSGGFVARHVYNNSYGNQLFTWKLVNPHFRVRVLSESSGHDVA